jgi:hypothetical protein
MRESNLLFGAESKVKLDTRIRGYDRDFGLADSAAAQDSVAAQYEICFAPQSQRPNAVGKRDTL